MSLTHRYVDQLSVTLGPGWRRRLVRQLERQVGDSELAARAAKAIVRELQAQGALPLRASQAAGMPRGSDRQ